MKMRTKMKTRMKMETMRMAMAMKMRMKKEKMDRTKTNNRKAAGRQVTKKAKNPRTNYRSLDLSSQMTSKFQMCSQKFLV